MEQDARASAPLITLFERDDSIAVPLLSQLRMAGYDVRSARTPVELFDILGKNLVTLVLVDLGAATAGRREFWVALDAQRRGRAVQVLTFRYALPASDFDLDLEPSARAIADVEVHGAHEFQRIIDAVRQRAPLHGPAPSASVSYSPDGSIQPLGAALGLPPTPYSMYGAPAAPSQQPGYGPGYGGAAFGMAPSPSMAGYASVPSQAFPQMQGFDAHMETTPFPPGAYGPQSIPFGPPSVPFGQQHAQYAPSPLPYGQSFPAQPASPFAHPTTANPFGSGVETSPFAQPYESNPFAQEMSAPSAPSNPFAQNGQPASPFTPAPPAFGQSFSSAPSAWGASSGGYVADTPGFMGWRTPNSNPGSFSSEPGANAGFAAPSQMAVTHRPQPGPNAPTFQDAWSPPDDDHNMQTGALPEDAFQVGGNGWALPSSQPGANGWALPSSQPGADAWAAAPSQPRHAASPPDYGSQERPWDAPRVNSGGLGSGRNDDLDDDLTPNGHTDDPGFAESTAAVATPVSAQQTQAMMRAPTPTETALGSVLVEGALLTPNKLETLRGIQEMLATVNQPRKLGELAVMFKFLSQDQLLAALLVSRGLVSPQQIASLGRVKQELAATGMDNDLETLLVRFNILPAEQLHQLRQELAS